MKKLFFSGFVQVSLVALNTYLISRVWYVGVFVASFGISFVWSWNVKKVAFGSTMERIVYALGAACGAVCGLAVGLWMGGGR